MLITTEGIVLKQRKIANNRRLLTIFTKDRGKITAGTGLNERSRNKSALAIRPFTYAGYNIYKNKDYYNVDGAQVIRSYYSIGEDVDRFMIASQMLEYLDNILEEEQPKPKLFEMALEFFDAVSESDTTAETMLYAFIVKTLKVRGVMPELKTCVNCAKGCGEFGYGPGNRFKLFSVSAGGIICDTCAEREKSGGHSLIYRPTFDIIQVLQFFNDKPLKYFSKVTLKPEIKDELRQILSAYVEYYMSSEILSDKFML